MKTWNNRDRRTDTTGQGILSFQLVLFESLFIFHSHTHTITHTQSHTHTHTSTHTITHTSTHSHTHTHNHTLSHTHTSTHTPSHSLIHTHIHNFSQLQQQQQQPILIITPFSCSRSTSLLLFTKPFVINLLSCCSSTVFGFLERVLILPL